MSLELHSDIFERLIETLKELPGVGDKTAQRFAYFILKEPLEFARSLSEGILTTRETLKACDLCCMYTTSPLCGICANPNRNDEVVCVVSEPSDVIAFEKSKQFQGKYHVLHGVLSPLEGIDERNLRIEELKKRIAKHQVKELILATNATIEGDTTALYLAKILKDLPVHLSRIAYGIPVGAEIEYLDGLTLAKAIQNRVSFASSAR